MQWERSMRWREYWHKQKQQEGLDIVTESEEEEEIVTENIFRSKEQKTNLPRRHSVPAALTACIAATRYSVLGAQLKKLYPNICPEVRPGGKDLVTLQRERAVTIKPSDKTGGMCIMDFEEYKEGMEEKLDEKFVDRDGAVKNKYVKCTEKQLKKQWQEVKTAVEYGRSRGFISEEDAKVMVPELPKAGRLYGLVKDHKPVPAGRKIPKLREVVSGSGSNTEFISAFVDHHAKAEVQRLPSYVEDTPDVLRKIM